MLYSMTGYGRCQKRVDNKEIVFEVKSVNHRYFDFSARVPRIYGFLEEKAKALVSERVGRGKVDVYISIQFPEGDTAEVELSESLLSGYLDALVRVSEDYNIPNDISVSSLIRLPDLFSIRKVEEDADSLWECVRDVGEQALDDFVAMRRSEGARLGAELENRIETIKRLTEEIEERAKETLPEYREKISAKVRELIGEAEIDESRILTDIAIFADKSDISEELVRLSSHFAQFKEMLGSGEGIGRKMDFLIQEMNREINTIGSKAANLSISQLVVEAKSEIEKLREQVQNIE